MIGRAIRFAAFAPLFVYGMVLLLVSIRPLSAASIGLALVIGLPAAAVVRPNLLEPLVGLSALMIGFIGAITLLSSGVPTGLGAELLVALLLGAFPWLLGVGVVLGDRPGLGLLCLTAGLAEIVSVGAALPSSLTTTVTPSEFVARWYSAGGQQFGHLGQVLTGRGLHAPGVFPYHAFAPPIFVGLAILAVAGLLLPWLRPSPVGIRAPVAVPRRDMAPSSRTVPWSIRRPVQVSVSRPAPGPGAGLVPIVGALLATGGLEAAALLSPVNTFLLAAGVTAFVVGTLVALTRLGRADRPPRRRTVASPPALSAPVAGSVAGPARPRSPP
jgi:hypothetical protein